MKRASHENGFMSSSDISICSEHGCWCLGKAWDVGLQPGHVSVSDLSTWPLIGICSVYLLADVGFFVFFRLNKSWWPSLFFLRAKIKKVPCASSLAMRLTWFRVLSGLRWFKHLGWVILFMWIWQQVEGFYCEVITKTNTSSSVSCKNRSHCIPS